MKRLLLVALSRPGPLPLAPTLSSLIFSRCLGLALFLAAGAAHLTAQLNYATPYTFTTLAGTPAASGVDGTGAAARFYFPSGVATDAQGNVFVADRSNHVIRKITPAGAVTTLAGRTGVSGEVDGPAELARFYYPTGLTLDTAGNIFVADMNVIRKITPAGVVSTIAGKRDGASYVDGPGTSARFSEITAVAVAADGTLYVADMGNRIIRKITPAGLVSTFAGEPNTRLPPADGIGTAARFDQPYALALDAAGNLFVTDSNASGIRKITPGGVVSTLAHLDTSSCGIALDSAGNLYVTDRGSSLLKKITPAGVVSTLAGQSGQRGHADGTGTGARFNFPQGLAADASGTLYVADTVNGMIRKVSPAGAVSTLAGRYVDLNGGAADGQGAAAQFSGPKAMAVDAQGNLYVADNANFTVRKITPAGVVSTLAGLAGSPGNVDGQGGSARFGALQFDQYPYGPNGIALDSAGNLFVTDSGNRTIRKITPAGLVTTFAGNALTQTSANGVGTQAAFGSLGGITIDSADNIYVSDQSTIRKITPAAVVTTLAGANDAVLGGPESGYTADGPGNLARFDYPAGLTVDSANNLYVADTQNHMIRKITPAGYVSTIAGARAPATGFTGDRDGIGRDARIGSPQGIAVDDAGNLYVIQSSLLRKITPAGVVSTIAGSLGNSDTGSADGTGAAVQFNFASGIAIDRAGALYVADKSNNTIRRGVYRSFAGDYFGLLTNNAGTWALHLLADGTGTYLAYFPARTNGVALSVSVDATGAFVGQGSEIAASQPGVVRALSLGDSTRNVAATTAFSLSGQISETGAVTGQLGGLGVSLSGAKDSGGAAPAGLYTLPLLAAPSGSLQVIVGASGQTFALASAAMTIDAASGTTTSGGSFTATTARGGQLTLALNARTGLQSAALTPAGSSSALKFSVLAAGFTSTTRLTNIATRAYCSTGNGVTIGGFVVSGSTTKRVLIRAVGPSLTAQGIGPTEVLLDPAIEVHQGSPVIAFNDNWTDNANAAEITAIAQSIGATAFTAGDTKSSALLLDLSPGVYSFIARGQAASSGIVLLEVYDADSVTTDARFSNIATRAYSTTGNGVTIGGFVISGNAPKKILLRAVGPTLTTQGLGAAEVLANPTIELHQGSPVIATNDNLVDNANAADLLTTGARIGATPLTSSDTTSSSLLLTLDPGVYSFIARGKTDASGVVLVEVYDAD